MSSQDNPLSQKLQHLGQSVSPQSKRNTKNLSLQLGNTTGESNEIQSPTISRTSASGVRVYRHPSLSKPSPPSLVSPASGKYQSGFGLKRRTTLSLSIPTEIEVAKNSSSSGKSSSNSVPSFTSSISSASTGNLYPSSPISSSPIIPSPPKEILYSQYSSEQSNNTRSSHSSNSTLQNESSGDLKTQTLVNNLSSIGISTDGDNAKLNAYPEGPACVLKPQLFLYSEPKLDQLSSYDLVINVAKELVPPIPFSTTLSKTTITKIPHDSLEYYYVPWTHTSKICQDLQFLTDKIIEYLQDPTKKILIHCQCGVSRSASLIVALFMKMDHVNLNDAYNKLKEQAPEISPNMTLIFQLMEWGEIIGVNNLQDGNSNCGKETGTTSANGNYNGYKCGLSPQFESVGSPITRNMNNNENNAKRRDSVLIHDDAYIN